MTMTKAETKTRLARRSAAHQKRVEKAMAPVGTRHRLRPTQAAYRLSGLPVTPQRHCGQEMKLYGETEEDRTWYCSKCKATTVRIRKPYGVRPKLGYLEPVRGRGQTGHQADQGTWRGLR